MEVFHWPEATSISSAGLDGRAWTSRIKANDIQFLAGGCQVFFGGLRPLFSGSICRVSGRFLSNFSLNGEAGAAHGRDKSNRWLGRRPGRSQSACSVD